MTGKLLQRAEAIAQDKQKRTIDAVAQRLRDLLKSASVEIEGSRIILRGKGLLKRWLIDPDLRFLAGTFR